jgi:hypothetical protein
MAWRKKTAYWPKIRIDPDTAEKLKAYAERDGIDMPTFRRAMWDDLLRTFESGEKPAMPPHVQTLREAEIMEAVMFAREAAEKLGLDVNEFRKALAKDFVRLVQEGETPALPPRMLTHREQQILRDAEKCTRRSQ